MVSPLFLTFVTCKCSHRTLNRSNFGFIVSGAICIGFFVVDISHRKDYKTTTSLYLKYPVWSLLTGISFVFLGICSFLFHASLTEVSQTLDVGGIYVAMLSLIAFQGARYRMFDSKKGQYFFIFVCLILDVLSLVYKHSLSSGKTLPGSVAVLSFLVVAKYTYDRCSKPHRGRTDLRICRHSAFWIFSICCFGIAYILWTADRNREEWICFPTSWFQGLFQGLCFLFCIFRFLRLPMQWCLPPLGHAAWHVLDSFSLLSIYLYGRSVNDIDVSTQIDVSFDNLLVEENGLRSDSDASLHSGESSFGSTRTRTSSGGSYQDITV